MSTQGHVHSSRQGFTLVELIVVISIISLLVTLLLPALASARQSAINIQCSARQKQLVAAYYTYAADYKNKYSMYYHTWLHQCYVGGVVTNPNNLGVLFQSGYLPLERLPGTASSSPKEVMRYCPSDSASQSNWVFSGYNLYAPGNIFSDPANAYNTSLRAIDLTAELATYRHSGVNGFRNWTALTTCNFGFADLSRNPHEGKGVNVGRRDGSVFWLAQPSTGWPDYSWGSTGFSPSYDSNSRFWRLANEYPAYP